MTEHTEQRDEQQKRQKGFTLIELMIVVAIIAILAAVAIPNFLRARDRSRIGACMEQLRNISTAMEDFIVERGNLGIMTDYHEVCTHMFAGFDDWNNCSAILDTRLDGVCAPGTANVAFAIASDFDYEISASANDRNATFICVTENEVTPPADDLFNSAGACP